MSFIWRLSLFQSVLYQRFHYFKNKGENKCSSPCYLKILILLSINLEGGGGGGGSLLQGADLNYSFFKYIIMVTKAACLSASMDVFLNVS